MMPVRKMGFRGSDWSYALASCLEYYVNLQQNFKDNLSPDYIALNLQALGYKPSISQGLNFWVVQQMRTFFYEGNNRRLFGDLI